MSTLSIERHKSKRAWVLLAVVIVLAGLNALNGATNYLRNAETFQEQGVTWLAVWGQGGLLWAILFFPFLITIRAASLTRMEHEQGNWRRLASYGAHLRVYRGKLLLLAGFVLCCQAAFIVVVAIASLLLGFGLPPEAIAAMLCWGLLGAIGGMTVAAIQLVVGIIVRSYATTVAIGLVASVGSLMATLGGLDLLYPYAQAGVGMRVRALDWPTAPETFGFLVWNIVLIVAAVLIGRMVLRRKEH